MGELVIVFVEIFTKVAVEHQRVTVLGADRVAIFRVDISELGHFLSHPEVHPFPIFICLIL